MKKSYFAGLFFKYSAIQILPDGLKIKDRNETADSIVACAGKCNAGFLESARYCLFLKVIMNAIILNN